MRRAFLKAAAARFAHRARLDQLADRRKAGEPLVIGYHRVVSDMRETEGDLPGMAIEVRELARQLEWVARHFRVVRLDE
ncbi:MAG TPA: hypothetical protein VMV18_09010, partial [bacterium]|nr:hypothetical protein [bacterium]